MITLSHIEYRYEETSEAWVLNGIDLCIEKGEYVLLCGGSGSGKSTIGYLLNGLIPHFFGGTLQGSVSVLGQDTRDLTVADLLSTVGLVFQNADAQLFNSTVENEIAFGLESLGKSSQEIETEIKRTAEALGIVHLLHRSPAALSGGEKRLVTIASVLSLSPPMIVLDEPFAHLDWDSAERIRTVLRDLHLQGKTLLVIEQHMNPLMGDVTRCLVLDKGVLRFDGTAEAAWPVLIAEHLLPSYPIKEKNGTREMEPLLRLKELSHEIDGKAVLRQVSFDVMEGEILGIVGRNGSGKTTLIKHFNGLLIALKERGLTIVIVTHDLDFAFATADRWVVVYQGEVVGVGSPSELGRGDILIQMGALAKNVWMRREGIPDGAF